MRGHLCTAPQGSDAQVGTVEHRVASLRRRRNHWCPSSRGRTPVNRPRWPMAYYYLPETIVFTPEDSRYRRTHRLFLKRKKTRALRFSVAALALELHWRPVIVMAIFMAKTPPGLNVDQTVRQRPKSNTWIGIRIFDAPKRRKAISKDSRPDAFSKNERKLGRIPVGRVTFTRCTEPVWRRFSPTIASPAKTGRRSDL